MFLNQNLAKYYNNELITITDDDDKEIEDPVRYLQKKGFLAYVITEEVKTDIVLELTNNEKNYRYPQIGVVIINDNSEIGCGSTIDRGSMSNTIIGKNTYLDNQIHIAHNVKIGDNCIIAGQVGFAGSSTIGNQVMIGGQAGVSGHLKIGNNVQIGGGSGVIKDIPGNSKVMGYPAKNLKNFIRENK